MANRQRRSGWVLAFIVLLAVAGAVVYAYLKPLPPITTSLATVSVKPASTMPLSWPAYGQAAVGAVGYGVLDTHGPQTPLPTASTAKIMTALAVLHEKPLALNEQGPTLTMTQADVDSYHKYLAEDGSVVPVSVGEQFSEYQALQALLLPSANNMAETLARWAFGSIDSYLTYANQFAQNNRWTSMTITDPSGFLPTTVASAHDLTLLGEIAIKNPVIAQIVAQPYATIPAVGTIYNVNAMLGHSNTIGIKTGNNDQDLGAYLFASTETVGSQTITLVGAIMNAPSLPRALSDSLPLITSSQGNFSSFTVLKKGEVVATYHVPWQGNVTVSPTENANVVAWNSNTPKAAIIPAKPRSGQPKGAKTGVALMTHAETAATDSVPLQLDSAIHKPSLWWRLGHLF